ncbi:MAG: hypothetical protein ACKO3K_13240 [Cuspidothrix sp.]
MPNDNAEKSELQQTASVVVNIHNQPIDKKIVKITYQITIFPIFWRSM